MGTQHSKEDLSEYVCIYLNKSLGASLFPRRKRYITPRHNAIHIHELCTYCPLKKSSLFLCRGVVTPHTTPLVAVANFAYMEKRHLQCPDRIQTLRKPLSHNVGDAVCTRFLPVLLACQCPDVRCMTGASTKTHFG